MATLRNKTTSEGVIIIWKSHPDQNSPKTYQVRSNAVSFLDDLGFKVPNSGDEVEVPSNICYPLRVLGDLYFKSGGSDGPGEKQIENIFDNSSQDLSSEQRRRLKKYIDGHKNYNVYSNKVNHTDSPESSDDNGSSNNSKDNQKKLQEREDKIARVDRISHSGNGIVKTRSGHINVGDITPDAVGEEIEMKMIGSGFAICLTKRFRAEGYAKSFREMCPSLSTEVEISDAEVTAACLNCGWIAIEDGDIWVCGVCESEFYADESGIPTSQSNSTGIESINIGEIIKSVDVTIDTNGNLCSERNNKIKINGDTSASETVQVEVRCQRGDYLVGAVVDPSKSNGSDQQSLEELRRKARESAVDGFSNESNKYESTTVQYSRSQEVKDYVKARADGLCEGCNEPAPFTSETGEPYLHAHHIHELSKGGPDTPDTVIALCPNCHYRVHHGDDGEEYNHKLSSKLQKLEDRGA